MKLQSCNYFICSVLMMFCKFAYQKLREKIPNYEANGHTVKISEKPLTVAVVTEIMKRAHSLPLAKHIVFVDTTGSCNYANHAITFLLTSCAAGGVPLAVLITAGQTTEDFITGK